MEKEAKIVSRGQLITIGTMIAARNMAGTATTMYSFAYIIDVFGLDLNLYVIANAIFFFYNTLNDFLFSLYADKPRFKVGRRIPWIRYGSLFIIPATLLFWIPWPGTWPGNVALAQNLKLIQFLVALFFSDAVSTVIGISYGAWIPEITESDKERTKIAIADKLGNFLGGLWTPILPYFYNQGIDIFRFLVILASIFYAIMFFIGSFVIKERPALSRTTFGNVKFGTIFKTMILFYTKRGFLASILFGFSQNILWLLIGAYPRLIGYAMGLGSGEIYVLAAYYIPNYLFLFVFNRMIKSLPLDRIITRIEKVCLVVFTLLFVLVLIIDLPFLFLLAIGVAGIMSSVAIFGTPITCNFIDDDELVTNERREALIGASAGLVMVPVGQILTIIIVLLLQSFGYQPGIGFPQPPSVILGVKVTFFLITIAGCLLTLFSIWINPFKGVHLQQLKDNILTLHWQKERGEK